MGDELMELSHEETMSREAAAARLRELADQLARHNQVEVVRGGLRYAVRVPDQVTFKVEVEVGTDNEIEVEISW